MQRAQVKSSSIQSVGYDVETKTLEIEFRSGGIYAYDEVPAYVFTEFMQSKSLGSYFQSTIRSNYRYQRLAEELADHVRTVLDSLFGLKFTEREAEIICERVRQQVR